MRINTIKKHFCFQNKNQILFKANQYQQEQKRLREELKKQRELYQEKLQQEPNTAFIFNPDLTEKEKEKLILTSDILKRSIDISSMLGFRNSYWYCKDCFVTHEFQFKNNSCKKIFDITNPINAANLKLLNEAKGSILNYYQFSNRYGTSNALLQRYIKEGHIKQFRLLDKNTKQMRPIAMIDVSDKENKAGIERLIALSPKESKYKEILETTKNPVYVGVFELASLGYGNPRELAQLVKDETLKGKITKIEKKDGSTKLQAKVNINDLSTANKLRQFKAQNCIPLNDFAKENHISIQRLEDLVMSGELSVITQALLLGDTLEVLIDKNIPSNSEILERLLFEKNIEDEIINRQKESKANEKRNRRSIQMRLAWHYCPNTRRNARKLANNDNKIANILNRKRELEQLLRNPNWLNESAIQVIKDELETLKREESYELNYFYKILWQKSGTEEFKNGIKKANEILLQYETNGIESINDEEIKKIIQGIVSP